MKKYRIAIDGPGGAGKSTVAKLLAKRLGILYVDTGALYRSIAYYMISNGVEIKDKAAVLAMLPTVKPELKFTDRQIVLVNGEDVGDKIRTPEISMGASAVSAYPEVRTFLLDLQRKIARENSVIMDGRDIGTVILPNADLKVFLFASPEARAKRRYDELTEKGATVTYEAVLSEMNERDKNDSTRATAPCVPAKDAILLDNSALTLEGTADKIVSLLEERRALNRANRRYMRLFRIFAPLIRFNHRLRVHGTENLDVSGRVMFCSNHLGALDVLLLAASVKRPIHFVAKKELFKIPILSGLIRMLGAVPLDRGGKDVSAIRKTVDLVSLGEAVSIFPQGHRYTGENPADTPIKSGVGLIAYHSGADVIPVCIKMKKMKHAFLRRKDIYFGERIQNAALTEGEPASPTAYGVVTHRVYSEICALGGFTPGVTPDVLK